MQVTKGAKLIVQSTAMRDGMRERQRHEGLFFWGGFGRETPRETKSVERQPESARAEGNFPRELQHRA
ncbi:unnamed protein product [Linum trigynum]|uniref:Uncharacterized protein n=1 Tax=Linum trigynum TaxID=586398 RepID=A0AAV2FFV3_9ROSI